MSRMADDKKRTPNVLRRRVPFVGLAPKFDRTGLWLQVKWLWFTWDFFPDKVIGPLGKQVDDMRGPKP